MFSKEEEKAIKLEFWQEFNTYCRNHPDLRKRKVPFVLHNTGINHVDLKFDVARDWIRVAVEVNHRNQDRRLDVYEYVEAFKVILEQDLDNVIWNFAFIRENGQEVGRAYVERRDVDFLNPADWPEIFKFMADKMIILQRNFFEIRDTLKQQLRSVM
ncbi:DUF4268 domain-containing protein [Saccharicrinis sp. FJH54]|uniref:DUF4268 domain-containing protein n=1 Tax=Saccharicrinis sp. FJH54 TaxID=3344665 RepID=UPI0035D52455